MRSLLDILLGVVRPEGGEGDRWEIEWMAAPSGDMGLAVLLGVLGCVWATYYLYRREARGLGLAVRAGLTVLRTGAVLGVVAMLLEPMLVSHVTEWIPSRLIVLVDTSASMGFGDAYGDEQQARHLAKHLKLENGPTELRKRSRLSLAMHVLSGGLLERLKADGDRLVKLHGFSDRFDSSEGLARDDSAEISVAAAGQTAIGTAVREAVDAYRGVPIAGIVLVSDGQSNAGPSPVKTAELVGGEGVPIAVLAMGTTEGPRNARVVKLEASPVVFVRDEMELRAIVESRSMARSPATLVLQRRSDGGEWEEVQSRRITLSETGRLQSVVFKHRQDTPATLDFRVTLSTNQAELDLDDNVDSAQVRVIRQKIRVLFVAGTSFPEVQFLRNALTRDRGISMSSWLQSADRDYKHMGDRPIRRLPVNQQELNEYDCVILYDPDPVRWPSLFPELLTGFVAQAGGGLVYISGERSGALFEANADGTAGGLLDLLPVIREPGLFSTSVDVRLSARQAWRLDITRDGKADPIFRFSDGPEDNQRILASLPGMYWHFPVTRAKPGATILARHGDPRMRNQFGGHVLLATHLYGPGRSFFVGFDSTYRWRYLDEQYFDGFWARIVDRAGRNKQLGGGYPFALSTDRATYAPGSQVTLSATFHDESAVEPGLDLLHGQIQRGNDESIPLTLVSQSGGTDGTVFSSSFTAGKAGPYFVKVWPGESQDTSTARPATRQFRVELPNVELERSGQDALTLGAIADASDGAVFSLDRANRMPDAFAVKRIALVQPYRADLWDSPLLWGSILFAVFLEWVLRKRYRLV